MTKLLLDSGDPKEYKELSELAKSKNTEIWGATTNPTLIAKNLSGKKLTQDQAFKLQKEIITEILTIVPGAVSAEVYADSETTAQQMIQQGEEIASWNKRMYVKLPTTIKGFEARTTLRKKNIPVNNTLVFSQQQIFAINLHEQIIRNTTPNIQNQWPPFISPFIGRLDDLNLHGYQIIKHGMKIKSKFTDSNNNPLTWILSASIRSPQHIKQTIDFNAEIITAPAKAYREWLTLTPQQINEIDTTTYTQNAKDIPYWKPPLELQQINTIEKFTEAIQTNKLDITHPLTDKGIEKFVADWKTILI
jgi:transaldolase